MPIDFSKLINLERLVIDMFEGANFSRPHRRRDGLQFDGSASYVPGLSTPFRCHVECSYSADGKELSSILDSHSFHAHSPMNDRRVKSFVAAHPSLATDEHLALLANRNKIFEVKSYIWDSVEIERVLLASVADSDFVIARNFEDYCPEILGQCVQRASEKSKALHGLAANKAAVLFSDLFRDRDSSLEAWIVLDMLLQPLNGISQEYFLGLYAFIRPLLSINSQPLTKAIALLAANSVIYSRHLDWEKFVAARVRTHYEFDLRDIEGIDVDTARITLKEDTVLLECMVKVTGVYRDESPVFSVPLKVEIAAGALKCLH